MLPPPAVPRQTAPAATPETIEVQVPPGAVPVSTLEFKLDDGRTIDVQVPEGARAGDPLQVPLPESDYNSETDSDYNSETDSDYNPETDSAESIEMQEELRADTRAAETGPMAAERWALPHWAEYIQQNNNDESSDDDSSYVPDENSDDETSNSECESSSAILIQNTAEPTAEPECECTAECAYNNAVGFTILFWLLGTCLTFAAGFEFTYTFEAAFNIHKKIPDKSFSTSAIICFVCLLLSVLFVFSLPFGPTWYAKCGGDRENFSGKG